MRLEHEFTVPAPIEVAWAAFNDLDRVVPCFPGAALTSYDGDDFAGTCKVKLGPVSLQYTGTGRFTERDPSAYRAALEAKGKDRRGNGTAAATVTARLVPAGAETSVTVETELSVTGKPAQFGRGLMQDVSDKMLAQFVACLTDQLGASPAAPAAAGEAAPGPAGATAAGPPAEKPAAPAAPAAPASPVAPAESGGSAGGGTGAPETSLDLGATLLPVLARRAVPYLIGAVLALLLRRLFRR
jgi:carbon monoxide dehydrogenase subunit G